MSLPANPGAVVYGPADAKQARLVSDLGLRADYSVVMQRGHRMPLELGINYATEQPIEQALNTLFVGMFCAAPSRTFGEAGVLFEQAEGWGPDGQYMRLTRSLPATAISE